MIQVITTFLSNPALAWPLLFVATAGETIWFLLLKKSEAFTVWPWNILSWGLVVVNIVFLAFALKTLPAGTVYAFWTGASAIAITVFGIYLFSESTSLWRLMFIGVIVVGLVGLHLSSR